MKVIKINIEVDHLPNGCSVNDAYEEGCIFNRDKYCVLKQALNQKDCFVQNNRGIVPEDCPLRTKGN